MNKLKVIDIILIVAIVVCVAIAGVLGFKVIAVKKETAEKQEQLKQQTIPVNDDPIDIGEVTEDDDYLDDLNNMDPVLESGEVISFIDENLTKYGDSVKFLESTNDDTIFTYVYDDSDVCFDARLDKNGLVSKVGDVHNALGNYPLVMFTGYFPEDKDYRIAVYKTLMKNHIYGYATVFMEAGDPSRMTVRTEDQSVNYIYVESGDSDE